MKKKVTIQDIADAVGYSKTTVSRYINGQTNMMSAETASRIKSVIELLDYHPSDLARSLKTKKTYTVGVVISDISSPFSASVVAGTGEILEQNGYVPLFINCHEEPRREQRAIESLVSKGVDGLIVNTTAPENDFLYGYMTQGIPIVLCDRRLRNYNMDIVEEDNEEMISVLVKHLKEQGYTRLALFTQDRVHSSAKNIRHHMFLKAVEREFDYNAQDDIYHIKSSDVESTVRELKAFMNTVKDDEVPAIIGANTVMTMLAYRAIKNVGYRMPNELGLCGTNAWTWEESTTWMEMLRPTVTCVTIHGYEIGRKCALRILEKIERPGGIVKTIRVDTNFQPNESTLRKKA
ncbi:MAG: LacI family transcriptional regulator [Hespellia sp.]|nr:LacI family transcriptional regulator [Hespellia sp.]